MKKVTLSKNQKLVLNSTTNFIVKRVNQLPYNLVAIEKLTKNARIELQSDIITGLQNGDPESIEIAQNLSNPVYLVKVPIEGIVGIDFLTTFFNLIRDLSNEELLALYLANMEEGSIEAKKVGLFLDSGLAVDPTPKK